MFEKFEEAARQDAEYANLRRLYETEKQRIKNLQVLNLVSELKQQLESKFIVKTTNDSLMASHKSFQNSKIELYLDSRAENNTSLVLYFELVVMSRKYRFTSYFEQVYSAEYKSIDQSSMTKEEKEITYYRAFTGGLLTYKYEKFMLDELDEGIGKVTMMKKEFPDFKSLLYHVLN